MGKKKQTTNTEAKNKVNYFYGTKKEWIKGDLNMKMSDIFKNAFSEPALVAEDEKGLYITGKSYVGAPLLDPYRMYNRVTPNVNTEGEVTTYSVNQ